ncbi:hypothetical protein EVAR_31991_1 [Eumeta japonica]|uniref:Uncharacterized protein n=1 Tax=Eumeta variegata TaxID=151549 RepID=A0A4C1VSK1_EUMVA|nr:hypothetical protein EVAR_31991_1 [Eumeta japonica]
MPRYNNNELLNNLEQSVRQSVFYDLGPARTESNKLLRAIEHTYLPRRNPADSVNARNASVQSNTHVHCSDKDMPAIAYGVCVGVAARVRRAEPKAHARGYRAFYKLSHSATR